VIFENIKTIQRAKEELSAIEIWNISRLRLKRSEIILGNSII
jgi:hypothetical protein